MLSDYLPAIKGYEILQGFALILFFTFFILLVIRVWKMSSGYISKMEILPLDNNSNSENKYPGDQYE